MKDYLGKYLANRRKTWGRRTFGSLLKNDCCSEGSTGQYNGCSCSCNNACATPSNVSAAPGFIVESSITSQPDGLTLQSLSAGEIARVEELYLPPALKKRMLSMGLTSGTEIAVVNKEGGRMIIAVRDSRLGLSSEMAAKITCRPAWESV